MNLLIVPGYGDSRDYIDRLTRRWPVRFGIQPKVLPFGTPGSAESYDSKWQAFEAELKKFDQTAVIGISFGASIALRALQDYPSIVSGVVIISGPHSLKDMDRAVVDRKYPLLNGSLPAFSVEKLPKDKIMTIRPLRDGVIAPSKVFIPGATNERIPVMGHAFGIAWALKFKAAKIAEFIKKTH